MRTNRILGYAEEPSAPATPPGFAICPFASPPHALLIQLAAMEQAYRQQLAAAQQRAVQWVLDHAVEAEN